MKNRTQMIKFAGCLTAILLWLHGFAGAEPVSNAN